MSKYSEELLENHIMELRAIAAKLRAKGSKFRIQRANELISRADSAEVSLILNKGNYK